MVWQPTIDPSRRPVYQAIVSALATDVRAGRLRAGDRLPPQRALARSLGVNLTTVMRAIAEAQRRGLVAARRGRGTYVQAGGRDSSEDTSEPAVIDLTINLPPENWMAGPGEPQVTPGERLWSAVTALSRGEAARDLLRYPSRGGSGADRHAGQAWLARRGVRLDADRVLVTGGADHGLFLALLALTQPGDTILAEDLTYPGLRTMAAMLGRRVVPVRTDAHGIDPDALRTACRAKPVLLFCSPTIQNPTATILPVERRMAVAAVARENGFLILEDDVYGPLATEAPPPIMTIAPERVVFVTSLSKCVLPGLRVGYVASGDDGLAERLWAVTRGTTWTPPALTSAVAGRWIVDGTADLALAAVRRENEARLAFAVRALAGHRVMAHPAAPHLWLWLPQGWTRAAFVERARRNGVAVLASDAFASTESAPEGVRVCLGAARDTAEARRAVARLAMTLREVHHLGPAVV